MNLKYTFRNENLLNQQNKFKLQIRCESSKIGIFRLAGFLKSLSILFIISFFLINNSVLFSRSTDTKSGQEIKYYVSPNGNDKNSGTLEKPFKTVEKARDEIRKLKNNKEDVIIYLRGGVYYIDKTIEFDQRDSGNGYDVVYKAYKDEKAIISGGKIIKNWIKSENGIFKSKVDFNNFRQLYVNNRRATRARAPNSGEYNRLKFWNLRDKEIILKSSDIKKWNNFEQVEIIVQLNWAESIMRLKSFETTGDYAYLKVQDAERDLVFKRFAPFKEENEAYHFENALEFLDQPGEWYYDKASATLYYKPAENENMNTSEVIAPTVETLLKVQGTKDNPVSNLKFFGIQFSHSTWSRPSEKGMLDVQAGQYSIEPTVNNTQYVERPPAAVYVSYSDKISFERNIFTHCGAAGIDLHRGTIDNIIKGNIFTDISGSGISVATFSDPEIILHIPFNPADEREICRNDTISNNLITKTGQDYPGTCGISCGYPQGIVIEHNDIFDLPYTGISVGWGWTPKESAMKNNQIQYNHIYDVLKLMCDGGGVYTLSKQPNSRIYKNYIHDISKSDWAIGSLNNGIFLDEGSSEITVEKNVFKNIKQGNIRHNSTFKLIHISNETFDEDVIKNAGLEKDYKDLYSFLKK